jgi:hypothetical protein
MHYWWPTACNGYGTAIEEQCYKCKAYRHRELKAGKLFYDNDWKPGKHPKSK